MELEADVTLATQVVAALVRLVEVVLVVFEGSSKLGRSHGRRRPTSVILNGVAVN